MAEISVLLADDHVVLSEALAKLVDDQPDMRVLGRASSGDEALRLVRQHRPQVLVIDISMPGLSGLDVVELLHRELPEVRVVMLTMHEEPAFLRRAIEVGAAGYVTKRAASQELLTAIREVAAGRAYVNAALTQHTLADVVRPGEGDTPELALSRLSRRERDVLKLVAEGYTSKEIAARLSIGNSSVDSYRLRIAQKLGLKSRAEMVRLALQAGLLRSS